MALVWQLQLKPHQKLVLLALADHANDEGYAWPGQASLARKVGVAERTLRDTIGQLCELGHLAIERPDMAGTNLYRVLPHTTGGTPPPHRRRAASTTGGGLPVNHKGTIKNQAAQLPFTYNYARNDPASCPHLAVDTEGWCAACSTQLEKGRQ